MSDSSSTTVITGPYIELNNRGQLLRFDLTQDVHRLGRAQGWADLVIPEEGWSVISGKHVVFVREGENYRALDGDGQGNPSTNGLFIKHTRVQTQGGVLLDQNAQLQIGQNPQNMILLNYVVKPSLPMTGSASTSRINLRSGVAQVMLGRELTAVTNNSEPNNAVANNSVPMTLDAPSVSRYHASLTQEGDRYVLRDSSTNGTYVNRKRITAARPLQDGDIIQIGPFTLLFRNEILEIFDKGDKIRIDALNLVRKVKYANTEKTILNNVSLAIEPGQLVAIVGGSGAGKSTLMKTLLGIAPTTSGKVLINGDDLRQNFDLYRSEIGYVPQDDIVHRNLTVEEVLSND